MCPHLGRREGESPPRAHPASVGRWIGRVRLFGRGSFSRRKPMEPKQGKLWHKCLQIIATRINRQSFRTWFAQSRELSYDGERLVVLVKNQFIADWLIDKYASLILDVVAFVAGREVSVYLAVDRQNGRIELPLARADETATTQQFPSALLNPKYTFDTFVVGEFNEMAYHAAMAVAEMPGKTKYNPLYIHGGVGLGKTHLLHAIGHFIKQNHPDKVVLAVTSERFTDLYISSLINKTTSKFNEVYRSADVLLVDDVQFFSGKEGIQNAFFHIFNSLHQRGQQIVLTSDVPPSKIKGLEERLRSRFEWGLMVDLQPPDFESRVAILRQKAEADGMEVPEDVLEFVAKSVTSNIRELEGALIKLLAYSSMKCREITVDFAREVMKEYLRGGQSLPRVITLEDILYAVARRIGVPPEQIRGKRRTKQVALARQIAMYLARKLTGSSLQHIGQFFGGRDHSTVVHACKVISQRGGEVERLVGQIERDLLEGGDEG